MAKTIFEEMGGTYVRQGDYFIPCLTLPAEKLKANNQLEWVRLMNNIRNRAAEIVTANLIYN